MPKQQRLSGKKVILKLKRVGFYVTHQRGSHVYLKNIAGNIIITVPDHGSKDLAIGTLHTVVVKQAGLTIEEFNNL